MQNDYLIDEQQVLSTNILVFAFVGDAVHSVYVRSRLAKNHLAKSGKLNSMAIKYVSAKGQGCAYDSIKSLLNEKESSIAKTARNAHTHNIAKNSDLETYKKATSFEAILGYLYMTGKNERLNYILDLSFNVIKENV